MIGFSNAPLLQACSKVGKKLQEEERKSRSNTPEMVLGPGTTALLKLASSAAGQQAVGGNKTSPGVPPPPRLVAAPGSASALRPTVTTVNAPIGIKSVVPMVNGNQAGFVPPVVPPAIPLISSISPPLTQPDSTPGTPSSGATAARLADQSVTTTKVTMPPNINPNQISRQLLSLPHSVTHKLDLSKSLSLKVNNLRFVVPPTCFISTPEGIKVFLPSGSLPQTMSKGPAKPLEFSISRPDGSNGSQTMKVCEVNKGSPERIFSDPDKSVHQRFRMSSTDPNPALCHMHTLHAGFEALLAIFGYLPLPVILRLAYRSLL